VSSYLEKILTLLKAKSGLLDSDEDMHELCFEEVLFLRIAYEFAKMYRADRTEAFLDQMDRITPSYEDYHQVFEYLQAQTAERMVFGEWVKFSLQLAIEDEVTRRNLVSLMFAYVGQVQHSYNDYVYMLRYQRQVIKDCDVRSFDGALDEIPDEDQPCEDSSNDQVIEIEIKEFRDLNRPRDLQEYCKPFSFESLVTDSDDVCRIAVIVARKLLDARIDEFSLCML
jgi:hypothetical protein